MNKRARQNAQHDKARSLLIECGYRCLWVRGPVNRGDERHDDTLECWSGSQGVVILQAYRDHGVDFYHANGVPTLWDELKPWLLSGPKQESKPVVYLVITRGGWGRADTVEKAKRKAGVKRGSTYAVYESTDLTVEVDGYGMILTDSDCETKQVGKYRDGKKL